MQNLHIHKNFLQSYQTISVVLENCDVYELDTADILDIACVAEPVPRKRNTYRTDGGFIKIASRAKDLAEARTLRFGEWNTKWDYRLKERLEMCDGCADVCTFYLRTVKGKELCIFVPYDPLICVLDGNEIEYSNCPSLEIDEEGNMIIAFGNMSKMPTRKDNDYAGLVVGWQDVFGEYAPKKLRVKIHAFSSFCPFGEEPLFLALDFEVTDKAVSKKYAKFVFIRCTKLEMDMIFPEKGDGVTIYLSKMSNGRIYVGLDGFGVAFYCDSIMEYDYYCNGKKEE